jgi:hypothetical protein
VLNLLKPSGHHMYCEVLYRNIRRSVHRVHLFMTPCQRIGEWRYSSSHSYGGRSWRWVFSFTSQTPYYGERSPRYAWRNTLVRLFKPVSKRKISTLARAKVQLLSVSFFVGTLRFKECLYCSVQKVSSLMTKNTRLNMQNCNLSLLYGCENWSLTLREGHQLKVF